MRRTAGQCAILLAGVALIQGQAISTSSSQPATTEQQQLTAPSPANGCTANAAQDNGAPSGESPNHKWHVKLGAASVSAGYISAPFFSPFYPYGFVAPGFFYPGSFYGAYAPFYGPYGLYYPASFAYAQDKGKVELTVQPRTAGVYLDGAYAGAAGDLKKIWLSPGAYDLEVSLPGAVPYRQRIYVLSGKSLKIKHSLLPQSIHDEN